MNTESMIITIIILSIIVIVFALYLRSYYFGNKAKRKSYDYLTSIGVKVWHASEFSSKFKDIEITNSEIQVAYLTKRYEQFGKKFFHYLDNGYIDENLEQRYEEVISSIRNILPDDTDRYTVREIIFIVLGNQAINIISKKKRISLLEQNIFGL